MGGAGVVGAVFGGFGSFGVETGVAGLICVEAGWLLPVDGFALFLLLLGAVAEPTLESAEDL